MLFFSRPLSVSLLPPQSLLSIMLQICNFVLSQSRYIDSVLVWRMWRLLCWHSPWQCRSRNGNRRPGTLVAGHLQGPGLYLCQSDGQPWGQVEKSFRQGETCKGVISQLLHQPQAALRSKLLGKKDHRAGLVWLQLYSLLWSLFFSEKKNKPFPALRHKQLLLELLNQAAHASCCCWFSLLTG